MTSDVDICNRALSEIGSRVLISSLNDSSTAAVQCKLHYTPLREQLTRTAPWGHCRKTAPLSQLGTLFSNPPTSPYPWLFKYTHPPDCLKVRYILRQPIQQSNTGVPVVGVPLVGEHRPNRTNRYVVAVDDSSGADVKVILSNVDFALAVYNKDVVNPDIWDPMFQDAMVAALKNKIVLAITGNAGMKPAFAQECEIAITKARAVDANESIPTTDFVPDWIQARGGGDRLGWGLNAEFNFGFWNAQWDSMSWSS